MTIKANEARAEAEKEEKEKAAKGKEKEGQATEEEEEAETAEEEETDGDEAEESEGDESDDSKEAEGEEAEEEDEGGALDEADEDDAKSNSRFDKKLDAILTALREAGGDKSKESNEDKTWTLEDLRKVDARIESGELDPKYKSWVAEKRSEIIANSVAERTRAEFEFNGKWSDSMSKAKKDFPELKDPKSALYKEARKLVFEDPTYQKYAKAIADGKKVDPVRLGLDPDLQYKCAERAAGRISKKVSAQPKSKALVKDALEGGGRSVPQTTDVGRTALDKLEAKAVNTGSQSDWKRYFVAREQHIKAKKR